jgi:hypothetical protein
MNTLLLAVIALVAFIYCGGSRVPPVLRQNKDMILGVVGGLVLGSFFGLRLEGLVELSEAKKKGIEDRRNVLDRRAEKQQGIEDRKKVLAKRAALDKKPKAKPDSKTMRKSRPKPKPPSSNTTM